MDQPRVVSKEAQAGARVPNLRVAARKQRRTSCHLRQRHSAVPRVLQKDPWGGGGSNVTHTSKCSPDTFAGVQMHGLLSDGVHGSLTRKGRTCFKAIWEELNDVAAQVSLT